jgi:hypothetical protein
MLVGSTSATCLLCAADGAVQFKVNSSFWLLMVLLKDTSMDCVCFTVLAKLVLTYKALVNSCTSWTDV